MKDLERRCKTCNQLKSIDLFPERHYDCKKCYSKKKSLDFKIKKNNYIQYCINNPNEIKECNCCKESLLLKEFTLWSKICKKCKSTLGKEQRKLYRENNKELIRQQKIEFKNKFPKRTMLHDARTRAKKQNVQFNITEEDIIIPKFCPVLGIKLEFCIGYPQDCSPSLDKIIPELGYVKGNIRVISYRANSLKRDGNLIEIEKVCYYINNNSPLVDYQI